MEKKGKVFVLFSLIFCFVFYSCKKEELLEAAVIRDCTGTYLRVDKLDYAVCNLSSLTSYEDGSAVRVSFTLLSECSPNAIACMMLHPNEGYVKVTGVTRN
jgi:hypothetical protein